MDFKIEICSVANGATKKEIGRAKEYIVKQLGLEKGQTVEMGTIHAGDFMVSISFCFFHSKEQVDNLVYIVYGENFLLILFIVKSKLTILLI